MYHKFGHSAVIVAVDSKDQVPLVIERSKPQPHYWKFPGGGSDGAETPAQTAQRELYQETGLWLPLEAFIQIDFEDINGHGKYFFFAQTETLESLVETGDEGEEVATFNLGEILSGELKILPAQQKLVTTLDSLMGKNNLP